jgi:hypothetical protein
VILGALTNALTDIFLVSIPFIVVALIVALLLEERPLRTGGPQAQSAAPPPAH